MSGMADSSALPRVEKEVTWCGLVVTREVESRGYGVGYKVPFVNCLTLVQAVSLPINLYN